jgi:hypothetical protein
VRWMVEIGVAIFFAFEGENPAVGESFVEVFGGVVCAVFERADHVDFLFEGFEFLFDFGDVFLGSSFLELEGDDVLEHGFFSFLFLFWFGGVGRHRC